MAARPKPQILLVDDEVKLLEGLVALLRREYDTKIATSGPDALRILGEMEDLAVVVSDMRMPNMDGAAFLNEVMYRRPDATRIMLTGEPGRDGAMRAVNQGQIFRFLVKPCPIEELRLAVEAGVVQHRVIKAERSVLVETLIGSIKALMEVLAIANPLAFGRAHRIRERAMDCARRMGTPNFWQLDAAALLSQVGYVTLPPAVLEKMHEGKALTSADRAQVAGAPDITEKILEHIPRLEPVIQILAALRWTDEQLAKLGEGTTGTGARILGAVLAYEEQISLGRTPEEAFTHLGTRGAKYGAEVLLHLESSVTNAIREESATGREIPLREVVAGMIILTEIRHPNGALIAPRHYEVGEGFRQRIENVSPELLNQRVRVIRAKS